MITGYWLLTTILLRNGGVPLEKYHGNKKAYRSNAPGPRRVRCGIISANFAVGWHASRGDCPIFPILIRLNLIFLPKSS
jgi:hypothetical protein